MPDESFTASRPAVEDYVNGMSLEDIAAKYGVETGTVRRWLEDSKIDRSQPRELTSTDVEAYARGEATYRTIAATLGRSEAFVRNAMYRAGVPVKTRAPNTSVVLDEHDQVWLRHYQPDLDIGDASLRARLNRIIKAGSRHMHRDMPEEERATVVEARWEFVEALGIVSCVERQARERLVLPSNIIMNSRVLARYGIDAGKVVRRTGSIRVLMSRADGIETMIQHIAEAGANAPQICKNYPDILALDPEVFSDRLAHLESLGIRTSTVLAYAPQVLAYPKETVSERFTHFQTHGIDASKLANRHPRVLTRNPRFIDARCGLLRHLGLDPARAIPACPSSGFGLSDRTVTSKVTMIRAIARVFGEPELAEECLHRLNIMNHKPLKLFLLSRIWATYIDQAPGIGDVALIGSASITPVASYIIAIGTNPHVRPSLRHLHREAGRLRFTRAERTILAADIASSGRLGHIGRRYLQYAAGLSTTT